MLPYLTNFILQEKPEDDSMVDFSRPGYNGLYSTPAKPIETLELHPNFILHPPVDMVSHTLHKTKPGYRILRGCITD